MDANSDSHILKKYREKAIWGGVITGALIGTLAGGPQVSSWSDPIKTYSIYIFGGAIVGTFAGFLFFHLFLSSLAGSGAGIGNSADSAHSGSHAPFVPSAEDNGGFSDGAGDAGD